MAGEVCFNAPFPLYMASGVLDVVIANFDGDPALDLLAVSVYEGAVVLRVGNGDGEFGAREVFLTSVGPNAGVAADFDGDGFTDVAVTSAPLGHVAFMRGTGSGFPVVSTTPLGTGASAIAAADLGGSDRLDVIALATDDDLLQVQLSDPAPFVGLAPIPVADGPNAISLADLNEDDNLDAIVTSGAAGTVSVLLGSGDGGFGPPNAIDVGVGVEAAVGGDINGDGIGDLIVAADLSLLRLFGTDVGSFGTAAPIGGADNPWDLSLVDLDRDGDLDIAATSIGDETLRLMINDGTGTFAEEPPIASGDNPYSLAVADLNEDGALDIVCGNFASGTFTIVLANP